MIALVGDAELDEGNIFEAVLEGWKQGLRNCWWIIDYNRQSLDAIVREGLWERYEGLFQNFGWDVVIVKYGSLQQAAFREPGGETLRQWIDACPNQLYSALVFQGGAAWRKRLLDDIGDQDAVTKLIESRSDEELARLMNNLGGHDLPLLIDVFERIDHDRPTCFICYTVKGFGLPFAGHKDNHAGLMTVSQMEGFRAAMNIRPGHEWEPFEGLSTSADQMRAFLKSVPFAAESGSPPEVAPDRSPGHTRSCNPARNVDPDRLRRAPERTRSRHVAARRSHRYHIARRHDLDQPRCLGQSPRSFRAPTDDGYVQKRAHTLDVYLGILAQGPAHRARHRRKQSLHPALGARALAFHNGERLIPIGTLYDPFIARGLDALNYACYQDARFIVVATPSGITLAPEGGAHQSIAQPLIGMAQDGLAAFEPAFVDELAEDPPFLVRLHSEGRRWRAIRAQLGCATRPAVRSICACRRGRSSRSSER